MADTESGERLETAACFCGAVTAEMHGEPFWIAYDHDDDCRKALGSPLTIWVGYRPDQVVLTGETPKPFSKTPGVVRTFCPECGTSVSYWDDGLDEELYLAIGFLNNPERFPPQAHAFWSMKLPFVEFGDELPRMDGYSRNRDPGAGNPNER